MMASSQKHIAGVLDFYDKVYKQTNYEDAQDAEAVFSSIRENLPAVAQSSDGAKVIRFGEPQAIRATSESGFRDVIKVIWRMTKSMSGTPEHKLSLFVLGSGVVCSALQGSANVNPKAQDWIAGVEKWLGTQLTIGGKGCAGEGEGSVHDRIHRFLSTPYLHDFD